MGLDMYLTRKVYVKNWDHMSPAERTVITAKRGDDDIATEGIAYLVYEVGYWRKANQIHAWFVDNVQDGKDDCATYHVSADYLQRLLDVVADTLLEPNKAPELLPTREGFFFGSADYDESYFDDLRLTKSILEAALQDDSGDYEYHSSW